LRLLLVVGLLEQGRLARFQVAHTNREATKLTRSTWLSTSATSSGISSSTSLGMWSSLLFSYSFCLSLPSGKRSLNTF
jgi:hypothetical protein